MGLISASLCVRESHYSPLSIIIQPLIRLWQFPFYNTPTAPFISDVDIVIELSHEKFNQGILLGNEPIFKKNSVSRDVRNLDI